MLPKWHLLFGFVASYIFVYFFEFSLFAGMIIFLSSFLIDIDHYLLYIYKIKNFNLIKSFQWCVSRGKKWSKLPQNEKNQYKTDLFLFHGVEFLIILVALSFFHKSFILILIGGLIHLLIDILDLAHKKIPLYAKLSQIYVYQKNKDKKEFK